MNPIDNLLKGYEHFYQQYYIKKPETYQNLVTNGQAPHTLVIACSDSRVDPSTVLNTKPGEIFVVRNVANLVPAFDNDHSHCHGTSAAIEYAVKHLQVENILILGHTHCGGIQSLLSDQPEEHDFIDTWLLIADEAKAQIQAQNHSHPEACRCCEKEAIRLSLRNLMTFPFVARRVQQNKLKLHGWLFDLESGRLEKL